MLATCIATINNLVKSIKAVFLSHFNPQDYIRTKIPAKIRGLRKKKNKQKGISDTASFLPVIFVDQGRAERNHKPRSK